MRLKALIGLVALAACSKADAPAPADSSAVVAVDPAPAMSMASVAGMWNVNVMPADRDTVLTSYVLNAMDSDCLDVNVHRPDRTLFRCGSPA